MRFRTSSKTTPVESDNSAAEHTDSGWSVRFNSVAYICSDDVLPRCKLKNQIAFCEMFGRNRCSGPRQVGDTRLFSCSRFCPT